VFSFGVESCHLLRLLWAIQNVLSQGVPEYAWGIRDLESPAGMSRKGIRGWGIPDSGLPCIAEGTQQEPSLDSLQLSEESIEIHLGIAVIVTLIRAHVGRIEVKERFRRIPASDNPQRVTALDLHPL